MGRCTIISCSCNVVTSVEGQLVLDADNPNRDKLTVHFPKGVYQTQTGSIFVKSSWKILTEADNEGAFFRTQAYVYEEAGVRFMTSRPSRNAAAC